MRSPSAIPADERQKAFREITIKSDRFMVYVLLAFFLGGFILAPFYDTYLPALGVGVFCVAVYFTTKLLLPQSVLYQYILSIVFGLFSALYIYQMRGLSEMHFFFFVGSTLLITYQNWRLQLPLLGFLLLHHSILVYLQNTGIKAVYFTTLDYMDAQTFLFHVGIACIIIAISAYCAYDLEKKTLRETHALVILEKQLKDINNNIAFANAISQGNLLAGNEIREGDALGNALRQMRDNLLASSNREKEDRFITTGIATIGDILRRHTHNIQSLSDELLATLIKYVNANQGALFILEEDDKTGAYLQMVACYAYERKKFITTKIEIGQGLVGQCFLEGHPVLLKTVPADYVRITSGLGAATPRNVVLVPLRVNVVVQGVLELASFHNFSSGEMKFLEKVCESIASTIVSARTTKQIKTLLAESQKRSEELRSQEEEMRQNMEELNAVQEQLTRQLNETEAVKDTLKIRESVLSINTLLSEADLHGAITFANEKFCAVSGYSPAELLGRAHNIVRHPEMPEALFEEMWTTIKAGHIFQGIIKNKRKDGTHYWVEATIVPIKGKTGEVVKYIGARYHIKDDTLAEKLFELQLLGLKNRNLVLN